MPRPRSGGSAQWRGWTAPPDWDRLSIAERERMELFLAELRRRETEARRKARKAKRRAMQTARRRNRKR